VLIAPSRDLATAAAHFIDEIAIQTARRGLEAISVIVLPLAAYIVIAAALAASPTRSRLLALVAAGTFLAQTHLAMTPIVAALGVTAAWNCRRLSRRTWTMAVVLGGLLWTPPLVEQLTRRPGNLFAILRFFFSGGSGQDLTMAIGAWSSSLTSALRPAFFLALGADYVPALSWFPLTLAASLIAGLAALTIASSRSSSADAWLVRMCLIASVVAFLEATRIQDHIIDHEVFWMSAVGVLSAAAIGGHAMRLTPRLVFAPKTRLVTAAVAWLMVAAVGADGMRAVLHRRRTLDDHAVDVLTDQIRSYLESARVRKPLFEIDSPVWPIAAGALLQIDKAGTRFAVGDRWVPMFGEPFTPTGDEDGRAVIGGSAAATFVTPIS